LLSLDRFYRTILRDPPPCTGRRGAGTWKILYTSEVQLSKGGPGDSADHILGFFRLDDLEASRRMGSAEGSKKKRLTRL